MKKRAPFKLKSGNKPSMAKIAGVSPMKQKVEFDPKKSEKVGTKQKLGLRKENKTITDKLKEYRKAMETPPNKRTKAQKELVMKINEQRAKEQNKAGMNIDEID
jgi:hypothetical protein